MNRPRYEYDSAPARDPEPPGPRYVGVECPHCEGDGCPRCNDTGEVSIDWREEQAAAEADYAYEKAGDR